VVADIPRGTAVQRAIQAPVPLSQPGGRAGAVCGGPPPGHPEAAAPFADPGTIAVARGLARRDPDGSVVFDLHPGPEPSAPLAQETVQRQDASEPSPGGEPPAAAAPPPSAPATATAPAARPAPASPPLDELARQLFGPLSARLKAELRLDRERAGLLTDLRQ
jgi:hypothetical protein